MTPQERDLLDRFLTDLSRARPGPRDAEAADRIDRALRGNPDAAYVLVQHAILADQALQDAQARIDELERGGPPQAGASFLGRDFGGRQGGGYAQGGYPPPPATSAPPPGGLFGSAARGPFSGGGGLGGFLRSAGTTAAGVAGGAFLFEGLSSMFGGHHGGQGFGGDREGFADAGGFPDAAGDTDFDLDQG